jgi:hypothetical protein
LLLGEARRELDAHTHNKVTTFSRLFALRHTEVREPLSEIRTRRTAAADLKLLPVDCLHSPLPAGQGFFEVEFDDVLDVVAFSGEEWMRFLRVVSFDLWMSVRVEIAYL